VRVRAEGEGERSDGQLYTNGVAEELRRRA